MRCSGLGMRLSVHPRIEQTVSRGVLMKQIKMVAGVLALGVTTGACAGPLLLSEGFNNVASLGAAGWVFTNASTPVGQSWFQGNSGIFAAQSGAATSYAAANFLSAGTDQG